MKPYHCVVIFFLLPSISIRLRGSDTCKQSEEEKDNVQYNKWLGYGCLSLFLHRFSIFYRLFFWFLFYRLRLISISSPARVFQHHLKFQSRIQIKLHVIYIAIEESGRILLGLFLWFSFLLFKKKSKILAVNGLQEQELTQENLTLYCENPNPLKIICWRILNGRGEELVSL